jgi:hypothetical protein
MTHLLEPPGAKVKKPTALRRVAQLMGIWGGVLNETSAQYRSA